MSCAGLLVSDISFNIGLIKLENISPALVNEIKLMKRNQIADVKNVEVKKTPALFISVKVEIT